VIGTVDGARELGAFLRTRRERLTPGDVALPERRRRRTPGLRREDVAELAGVSVDYIVRLEQARGLRPSPEVLEALAGALRLSADERSYLFDLARQRPTDRPACVTGETAAPVARLVHDLSPLPAMLVDHRFDVLAWNPEMDRLMMGLAELPGRERNTMRLCLLDARFEGFYRDRERVIREGVADLRAAWAARPDDRPLAALVDELVSGSPEFARLWEERAVRVNGRGRKPLRHPEFGDLTVEFEVLIPVECPDLRLVLYRGADPASREVLARISRDTSRDTELVGPR
jgi:transcriptional regulator with XRE-family HTH domain